MKIPSAIALALAMVACTTSNARIQEAGPYVYKSSIRLNTYHYLRYWPNPNAKEPQYNTGAWTPKISFNVQGPLEGGSQVSVTFTKPNGATWFSTNLETPEIPADQFAEFNYDDTSAEKKAVILAGTFGVTINLSNSLTGTKKTLFSGKFNVGKFHYGSTNKDEVNNFDYYVNHDWNLPIAQMTFDEQVSEDTPRLVINAWFRGPKDQTKMAGYLFHNGKQVASTKNKGSVYEKIIITPGTTTTDYIWSRWQFHLTMVAETRKSENENVSYPEVFFLDKNPGEYEFKVLYDGKLARTAKFTIGPDGKLVDNGLATQNKMGKGVILLPITVLPGADGKAVITNYKAGAYYGNAVIGFP